MNVVVQDLVLALLTRIQERGGSATKTKLLKLLYLADIEHFRKFGKTLTGFDWIFYRYGPWAAEYDGLLERLEESDLIRQESWTKESTSGYRLHAVERRELDKVIESADEYFRVLHQVDTWASRGLPELLNYVYFNTDPMRDAKSLEKLNFDQIDRTPPPLYRRSSSGTHPEKLKRMRAELAGAFSKNEKLRDEAALRYGLPSYGESYQEALAALAEDDER